MWGTRLLEMIRRGPGECKGEACDATRGLPRRLAGQVRWVARLFPMQEGRDPEAWLRERATLALQAASVGEGQSVVELGAMSGRTTCFLALGSAYVEGLPVWAIDRFRREDESGTVMAEGRGGPLRSFRRTIRRAGVRRYVVGVGSSSVEAAEAWDGSPVGMLVLNEQASLSGCVQDIEAWRRHLAEGAKVVVPGGSRFDQALPMAGLEVDRAVEGLRFCHTTAVETPKQEDRVDDAGQDRATRAA